MRITHGEAGGPSLQSSVFGGALAGGQRLVGGRSAGLGAEGLLGELLLRGAGGAGGRGRGRREEEKEEEEEKEKEKERRRKGEGKERRGASVSGPQKTDHSDSQMHRPNSPEEDGWMGWIDRMERDVYDEHPPAPPKHTHTHTHAHTCT